LLNPLSFFPLLYVVDPPMNEQGPEQGSAPGAAPVVRPPAITLMNELANLNWTLARHMNGSLGDVLPANVRAHITSVEGLIPTIVVVGNQNSGKSSLLRALTGVNLPVAVDLTTICKIEVQMRSNPSLKPDERRHYVYSIDEADVRSPAHVEEDLTVWEEVTDEINEHHQRVRASLPANTHFALTGHIVITIEGAEIDNVSFVDLPGLRFDRAVPTEMARAYMRRPNTFILHIVNPTNGLDGLFSAQQLQEAMAERGNENLIGRLAHVFTTLDVPFQAQVDTLVGLIPPFVNTLPSRVRPFLTVSVDRETNGIMSLDGEQAALQRWSALGQNFQYGRAGIMAALEAYATERITAVRPELEGRITALGNEIGIQFTILGPEPQSQAVMHHHWLNEARNRAQLTFETGAPASRLADSNLEATLGNIVAPVDVEKIKRDVLERETDTMELPLTLGTRHFIDAYFRLALPDAVRAVKDHVQKLKRHVLAKAADVLNTAVESCHRAATELVLPQVNVIIENNANSLLTAATALLVPHEFTNERRTNFVTSVANELEQHYRGYGPGTVTASARNYEANRINIQTKYYWKYQMADIYQQLNDLINAFVRNCSTVIVNAVTAHGQGAQAYELIAETQVQLDRRAAFHQIVARGSAVMDAFRGMPQ